MKTLKLVGIGLYLAIFVHFLESIITSSWRWSGKHYWLFLPTFFFTVIISFLVTDKLRYWQATRKKKLVVASLILGVVVILGTGASLLNLYWTKLELSKMYP